MILLLVIICNYIVLARTSYIIHFIKDEQCSRFYELAGQFLFQETVKSEIDCVRICIRYNLCWYVRMSSDVNGTSLVRCESFSRHDNRSISYSQVQSSALTEMPKSTFHNASCYMFRFSNSSLFQNNANAFALGMVDLETTTSHTSIWTHDSTLVYSYEDKSPDLQKSDWFAFIDSNYPETQTAAYMKKQAYTIDESKSVVLDTSGNYLVLVNTDNDLRYKRFKGSMLYAIEKNDRGFKENASRIVYTCLWEGILHKGLIYLNGSSRLSTTELSQMRIFTRNVSEYTLHLNVDDGNVSTLVKWLDYGYKISQYTYARILYNRSSVAMYSINEKLNLGSGKIPVEPLLYTQRMQEFPIFGYTISNKMGSSSETLQRKTISANDITLSPFWRRFHINSLDTHERITILAQQIHYGHTFRVGFNGTFYDVADVHKVSNDIYFILPQQVTTPTSYSFTHEIVGVRAVVSLGGFYFSCRHPLEGEQVLETEIQNGLQIQPFVDKKAWTYIFSIYSNGTICFGYSADIAEAAVGGKDVNILIKWLKEDKFRLLTISMLEIKDYGQPNVSVNAESKTTWNLGSDMKINSRCDMEKVLVKSNGEVNVLVYNIHSRQTQFKLVDVKTIWFVF